jgi:PAS domain-containing protein
MKDEMGSKEQSMGELGDLRKRVAELEALEAEHQHEKMALWERAERYRQVVKKANEAMLVIQSGIIRFVNSKALELFGYSGELTPRSFA